MLCQAAHLGQTTAYVFKAGLYNLTRIHQPPTHGTTAYVFKAGLYNLTRIHGLNNLTRIHQPPTHGTGAYVFKAGLGGWIQLASNIVSLSPIQLNRHRQEHSVA